MTNTTLTLNEQALIASVYPKRNFTLTQTERQSDREYDVIVRGLHWVEGGQRSHFSAWLPLAFIREKVRWTSPEIAAMTDYPAMAVAGDWSGVRDTSSEKIWAILDRFVTGRVTAATKAHLPFSVREEKVPGQPREITIVDQRNWEVASIARADSGNDDVVTEARETAQLLARGGSTFEAMRNALFVITTDPKIAEWLQANDPKAWAQATSALERATRTQP